MDHRQVPDGQVRASRDAAGPAAASPPGFVPIDHSVARLHRARRPLPGLYSGNTLAVMERALTALRTSNWAILVSGFFEPVLYLLAMGLGMGAWWAPSRGRVAARSVTRPTSPRRCWPPRR